MKRQRPSRSATILITALLFVGVGWAFAQTESPVGTNRKGPILSDDSPTPPAPQGKPYAEVKNFIYRLKREQALPLAESLHRIYPHLHFSADLQGNALILTGGTPMMHERLRRFLTYSELTSDEKAKRGLPEFVRTFLEGKDIEMVVQISSDTSAPVAPPAIVTVSQQGGLTFQEREQSAARGVTLNELVPLVATHNSFIVQSDKAAPAGIVAQLVTVLRQGDKGSATVTLREANDKAKLDSALRPGSGSTPLGDLSIPTHGIISILSDSTFEWRPSSLLNPSMSSRIEMVSIDKLYEIVPVGIPIRVEAAPGMAFGSLAKVLDLLRQRNATITITSLQPTFPDAEAGSLNRSRAAGLAEPVPTAAPALQVASTANSTPSADAPHTKAARKQYQNAEANIPASSRDWKTRQSLSEEERKALHDKVRHAFEARQQLLRQEIAEFHNRLDRLNQMLEDRERAKDTIIDRRVAELLDPNLRWDATDVPATSAAPSPAGTANPSPTSNPLDTPHPVSGERSSLKIFKLKYASATDLAITLEQVRRSKSISMRTSVDKPGNSLIVFAPPADMQIIEALLTHLDIPPVMSLPAAESPPLVGTKGEPVPNNSPITLKAPGGEQQSLNIFRLRHVTAGDIENMLRHLSSEETFAAHTSVDVSTNSLIVSAQPNDMHIVEALILKLDVPRPQETFDAEKELARWQGQWLIVSEESDGKLQQRDKSSLHSLTVAGTTLTISVRNSETNQLTSAKGVVSLSSIGAGPKVFVFQTPSPVSGIYKFSEGKLVICYYNVQSPDSGALPTSFQTTPGSGLGVLTFDKVATAAKDTNYRTTAPTVKSPSNKSNPLPDLPDQLGRPDATKDLPVPLPNDDARTGELDGLWEAIYPSDPFVQIPEEKRLRLVVHRGVMGTFHGNRKLSLSKVTLDTTKSPHQIILEADRTLRGIYEIKDGGLRLSVAAAELALPTRFGTENPEFKRTTTQPPQNLLAAMYSDEVGGIPVVSLQWSILVDDARFNKLTPYITEEQFINFLKQEGFSTEAAKAPDGRSLYSMTLGDGTHVVLSFSQGKCINLEKVQQPKANSNNPSM